MDTPYNKYYGQYIDRGKLFEELTKSGIPYDCRINSIILKQEQVNVIRASNELYSNLSIIAEELNQLSDIVSTIQKCDCGNSESYERKIMAMQE